MKSQKIKDTPRTRACWLFQFCQCDLTLVKDQALEQLQNEWVKFQAPLWSGLPPVRNRLLQWQQEVNSKINELQNGQRWSLDCGLWRQLEFVNGQLNPRQRTSPLPDGAASKFLIRVMDTLEAVANDLRLCKREDCGTVFVKTKRQAYCSARCRGTEGTRRYRKNVTKLL